MSQDEQTYEGQCYCGAVKVVVKGDPEGAGYCHWDTGDARGRICMRFRSAGGRKVASSNLAAPTARKPEQGDCAPTLTRRPYLNP
jgi:hypothetical protein